MVAAKATGGSIIGGGSERKRIGTKRQRTGQRKHSTPKSQSVAHKEKYAVDEVRFAHASGGSRNGRIGLRPGRNFANDECWLAGQVRKWVLQAVRTFLGDRRLGRALFCGQRTVVGGEREQVRRWNK